MTETDRNIMLLAMAANLIRTQIAIVLNHGIK